MWPSLAVFLVPVAMSVVGLAGPARFVFLGGAMVQSFLLAKRSPASYVSFVVWLLALTPGLRHYVEYHSVFSQSNPMMLAPYGAMAASLPACLDYVLKLRRYTPVFMAMVAIVILGAWGALLTGALQDPLLTAVRWICPILLAIYVCAEAETLGDVRDRLISTLRVALPALSAYGLLQFVAIPPWDAYFMEMAPITSIGFPEPFQVRVFSTMNSPGSFAALLAFGMLLLLPKIRGWEFLSLLLAFGALFVTTQRAAMGALVLAVTVLALTTRQRQIQAGVGKMLVICGIALVAMLAMPEAAVKITGSLTSVTNLSNDGSAQERAVQYEQLGSKLESRPYGWGLAWSTNQFLKDGSTFALDSAIIDILVSFGVVGGIVFLGTLGTIFAQTWFIASSTTDPQAKAEFGAVIYGISQLPFGGQHAGEHGMFFYLAVGLVLARSCVPRAAGHGARRAPASPDTPSAEPFRPQRPRLVGPE